MMKHGSYGLVPLTFTFGVAAFVLLSFLSLDGFVEIKKENNPIRDSTKVVSTLSNQPKLRRVTEYKENTRREYGASKKISIIGSATGSLSGSYSGSVTGSYLVSSSGFSSHKHSGSSSSSSSISSSSSNLGSLGGISLKLATDITAQATQNPTPLPTLSPADSKFHRPPLDLFQGADNVDTENPTRSPIHSPTTAPSFSPSERPSLFPTESPTVTPSMKPTFSPSLNPTTSPNRIPTSPPISSPSASPSRRPTSFPSRSPTSPPSSPPSTNPTSFPTKTPTKNPSKIPTISPSGNPTFPPTPCPTSDPREYDIVYVLDRSSSTDKPDGCGQDANNDGLSDTVLDCEIYSITRLHGELIATGRLRNYGIATFDKEGDDIKSLEVAATEDISNELSGLTIGFGTNFEEGVLSACEMLSSKSKSPEKIILWLSDGLRNRGDNPVKVLDENCPPGVRVFTFAVGLSSHCSSGKDDLFEMANHNNGVCTEVRDVAKLPEVVSRVIGEQMNTCGSN